MKRLHFETLQPICPSCKTLLILDSVVKEINQDVLEGRLLCPRCLLEYPIFDGIPILVANVAEYISQNIFSIMARNDLSDMAYSLLSDCCGTNSQLYYHNYHLSIYAFEHYAAFDPKEKNKPSNILQILQQGLSLMQSPISGPMIDFGCSVGSTCFALGKQFPSEIILGVDLNYSMLHLASDILRKKVARYPKRKCGLVFEMQEFPLHFPNSEMVDFWACDALCLPFANQCFGLACSLNVLDCVANPYEHLLSFTRLLKPKAHAILTTPYDWSQVTPPHAWIGGHSKRSFHQGSPEVHLRSFLAGGNHPSAIQSLKLVSEINSIDWNLRIHERSHMSYQVHLLLLQFAPT